MLIVRVIPAGDVFVKIFSDLSYIVESSHNRIYIFTLTVILAFALVLALRAKFFGHHLIILLKTGAGHIRTRPVGDLTRNEISLSVDVLYVKDLGR